MSTNAIRRESEAAWLNTGNHAGVGVDSDDDRLYVNIDGTRRPVNLDGASELTAASTLTAGQSGRRFFLNSATEFATTLPSPAAGLEFWFYVKAAPSGASYTIVTASSANIIVGQVVTNDFSGTTDSDFESSGGDTITFVDGKAVKGDWVHVYSDGTNWYMTGACSVFDAITITTAS
jgi:hypothetical protein